MWGKSGFTSGSAAIEQSLIHNSTVTLTTAVVSIRKISQMITSLLPNRWRRQAVITKVVGSEASTRPIVKSRSIYKVRLTKTLQDMKAALK